MTTMVTDDWEGVRANNRTDDDVSWEQVEAAIRKLDGRRHTQVVLYQPDGSNLIVGGGAGRYNVIVAPTDEEFFTLLDTGKRDGIEELVAGGQLGEYPDRRRPRPHRPGGEGLLRGERARPHPGVARGLTDARRQTPGVRRRAVGRPGPGSDRRR